MQAKADLICDLIESLRNFSPINCGTMIPTNLNSRLENALTLLDSRLKVYGNYRAIEVRKEYSELPEVMCDPSQIERALINILNNAIEALEEIRLLVRPVQSKQPVAKFPRIRIRTTVSHDGDWVLLSITDNGCGITSDILPEIFDPFFTTKLCETHSGLGLSVSHQIIVEQHSGQLICTSVPNLCTEFVLKIPLQNQK